MATCLEIQALSEVLYKDSLSVTFYEYVSTLVPLSEDSLVRYNAKEMLS